MKISYKLIALKQLKRLPKQEIRKILSKIEKLVSDPFAGKLLKGELAGTYSMRVWPDRVLYQVEKKQDRITVVSIAHRQGVY